MRKEFSDAFSQEIKGCVVQPRLVNVSLYKHKSGFCPIACFIRDTDSNQVDSLYLYIYDYAKSNY
ncbi:MAG: hypothetical protein AAF757_04680, partial [Cyanobacteria bacterium P01_D01_bin.116]